MYWRGIPWTRVLGRTLFASFFAYLTLFVAEMAYYSSNLLKNEVTGNTLTSLVMIPATLKEILKAKLKAAFKLAKVPLLLALSCLLLNIPLLGEMCGAVAESLYLPYSFVRCFSCIVGDVPMLLLCVSIQRNSCCLMPGAWVYL